MLACAGSIVVGSLVERACVVEKVVVAVRKACVAVGN